MSAHQVLIEQRHVAHEAGEPPLNASLRVLLEEVDWELLLVDLQHVSQSEVSIQVT